MSTSILDFLSRNWTLTLISTVLLGGGTVTKPLLSIMEAGLNEETLSLSWVDVVLLIVGILIIAFGIAIAMREPMIRKYRKGIPWARIRDKDVVGVVYFNHRNELPRLDNELEDSHTVYALWHGGAHADACDIYKTGKIKRLLFRSSLRNIGKVLCTT